MNKSQRGGALLVGVALLISFVTSAEDGIHQFVASTLLIIAVLHLLWQTVMSFGTDVEPLDFFPATVLLLIGFIFARPTLLDSWPIPIALALVVGLGVVMRPFGLHQDELDELDELDEEETEED
jgi:hypothetical protein